MFRFLKRRPTKNGTASGQTPAESATSQLESAIAPQAEAADRFSDHYDVLIFDPLMRDYYGSHEFYNVGYWGEDIHQQAAASAALVDRLLALAPPEPAAILDVGCGLGATTAQIKNRWPSARVAGINISQPQLERCRANTPDCEFYRMDATKLQFADAHFDVIVCVEAAFHFDTRTDFLREAYRVLKPGGVLLAADILFQEGPYAAAISVWSVAQSNALPDMTAYGDGLARQGFCDILLEDITEASWMEWCRHLKRWLDNGLRAGTVTEQQWEVWEKGLPGLGTAVSYYLLAAAWKPAI